MKELTNFATYIKNIMESTPTLDVKSAREIVIAINDFLYTTHSGIGTVDVLGQTFDYFSEFHKFWHDNYIDILDCKIDDVACEHVADSLHGIYVLTDGKAFSEIWDTCGLTNDEVCRVRLFTANQDFRSSLKFDSLAKIYSSDPSIFDEDIIIADPDKFVVAVGLADKSQSDKRSKYASSIASFIKKYDCEPIDIIKHFDNDVFKLRQALIECNAGYGNKKADMFIRDMVVLGVWSNVKGFESIDVASDVNTMKVALRTGIITTAIPLLSSFLDIFCYQYAYIEQMNAVAWRRVWEIWKKKYPENSPSSPSLLDFFVYKVVGKEFCKDSLAVFQCEKYSHTFRWHSGRNRTCQVCYKNGEKGVKAYVIAKLCPCGDLEGEVAILQTDFVKQLPKNKKFKECPFGNICNAHKNLLPPKSISILGATGWQSAYTKTGDGGGGLMA